MFHKGLTFFGNEKWKTFFFLFPLGCLFLFFLWACFSFRIHYFDSYSLLSNTRLLLDPSFGEFWEKRPPLFSVILAPAYLIKNILVSEVIARIIVVCFYALLLGVAYRFFRVYLEKAYARIGVYLLAVNALMIHYAPFVVEYIPVSFFVMASFYFYLRFHQNQKWSDGILASLMILLSFLMKYHLGPIVIFVIFLYEMIDAGIYRKWPKQWIVKAVLLGVVPCALFWFSSGIYFSRMMAVPLREGFYELWTMFGALFNEAQSQKESPVEIFWFLGRAGGWTVLGLSISGIILSFVQRKKEGILFGLWLAVIVMLHAYVFSHKEARYLLPALPALYFFCGLSLQEMIRFLRRRNRFILAGVVLSVILLFPTWHGLKEIMLFRDPIYRSDFMSQVSKKGAQLKEGRLFWAGPMYVLYPKNYVFDRRDEYASLFHFHTNAIQYYTGQSVLNIRSIKLFYPSGSKAGVFVQHMMPLLKDGDVIIINREKEFYTTRYIPEKMSSLIVQKAEMTSLYSDLSSLPSQKIYYSKGLPSVKITLREERSGVHIWGKGVPYPAAQIALRLKRNGKMVPLPPVKVTGGAFGLRLPRTFWKNYQEIVLLGFSESQFYPYPEEN